jgi:restriction system protein
MASNPTVWGIHMGAHVSDRPIDGGYVAIGWTAMGDLRKISSNREAFKAARSGIIRSPVPITSDQ